MKELSILVLILLFCDCKENREVDVSADNSTFTTKIKYAKGFSLQKLNSGITVIEISSPWAEAETTYRYALVPRENIPYSGLEQKDYDAIIPIPVERVIPTSTTHIPALEVLGELDKLVGFPQTDMVSSKAARARIDKGEVLELGNNQQINTEMVISLNPDLVVGFGVGSENKAYSTLISTGIPVVYNGDWTEETPLGKAEWVKFFAPFFGKEIEADSVFNTIERSYNKARSLAKQATKKPTVLTGGLYKDVWHVAGGRSWMASFLRDANTDYLWKDTGRTGGISLSLETVFVAGEQADFWFNPSLHTSYSALMDANRHYQKFDAFRNKAIYSNAISKGPTGGLLFYELAPLRPDLVLQDLVHIFHPEILPNHELVFYQALN